MPVIKKNGMEENFDIVKLFASIRRSGVSPQEALEIANSIKKNMNEDLSTGEIKGKVHKELIKKSNDAAYTYSHFRKRR